tara:strand:- start:2016 stop:2921 length:906 start_codon:yes stop_codon:yes gene_type:complete
MSKTIREVTDEQFADGTTIDGNRIDQAIADVVDRSNAVKKRDLQRRWFQTQYVGGWSAPIIGTGTYQHHFPFLNMRNDSNALFTGTSFPDEKAFNEYRLKGHSLYTKLLGGLPDDAKQYAVTNAFYFRKPIIISGCSLVLSSEPAAGGFDNAPVNDFQYGSDTAVIPSGYADKPLNDLYVGIVVDNPFLPEDRRLNSMVYHRFDFDVDAWLMRTPETGTQPAFSDMRPPFAGKKHHAIFIDDQNLNIPLSRDSRVRFAFGIPTYGSGNAAGAWGQDVEGAYRPFVSQYYSWALTVLESVEE